MLLTMTAMTIIMTMMMMMMMMMMVMIKKTLMPELSLTRVSPCSSCFCFNVSDGHHDDDLGDDDYDDDFDDDDIDVGG